MMYLSKSHTLYKVYKTIKYLTFFFCIHTDIQVHTILKYLVCS